jgi:outer membrane protein OmpA-like peptidoglycan-associated protein
MMQIQARVMQLIGGDAPDITVDLIIRTIELHKQVEFVGGKAVVLASSIPLLKQITFAIQMIDKTCEEFKVPYLHMRIEGHTSYAKKSADGGILTSNNRAKAVVEELVEHGVPSSILHPVGHGCTKPLTKNSKDAANRRVEIHVMDETEAAHYRGGTKQRRTAGHGHGNEEHNHSFQAKPVRLKPLGPPSPTARVG